MVPDNAPAVHMEAAVCGIQINASVSSCNRAVIQAKISLLHAYDRMQAITYDAPASCMIMNRECAAAQDFDIISLG